MQLVCIETFWHTAGRGGLADANVPPGFPHRRLALALAAGPTGFPTGPARANAATDACREPLNPDRRTVYRYTNGSDTLGFGQVVVTATKADGHRYCMRIGFGGRTVVHSFSQASYLRRNGVGLRGRPGQRHLHDRRLYADAVGA